MSASDPKQTPKRPGLHPVLVIHSVPPVTSTPTVLPSRTIANPEADIDGTRREWSRRTVADPAFAHSRTFPPRQQHRNPSLIIAIRIAMNGNEVALLKELDRHHDVTGDHHGEQ